jgi:hypothetical protein
MNDWKKLSIEQIKDLPLVKVQQLVRQELVSQDVAKVYAHLWQTASPRFSLRVCNCVACKVNYGSLAYEPIG